MTEYKIIEQPTEFHRAMLEYAKLGYDFALNRFKRLDIVLVTQERTGQ